jgi:choloylglycine hydrolase
MAAVPPGGVPLYPNKETVDSLGIIRVVLDRAATVDEAVELFHSYNVDFSGQENLHYLLADAGGAAALVEYYRGEIHVVKADGPWHQATNFIRSAVDSPDGQCHRHDAISAELEASRGVLGVDAAFELLERVAQSHTQWSVIYDLSSGEIRVAMSLAFDRIHEFRLDPVRRRA